MKKIYALLFCVILLKPINTLASARRCCHALTCCLKRQPWKFKNYCQQKKSICKHEAIITELTNKVKALNSQILELQSKTNRLQETSKNQEESV